MDVVSECLLRVASMVWMPRPGAWALTVVCKATYVLAPGTAPPSNSQDEPAPRDVHAGDDERQSLVQPCDLAPFKRRCDVVLVGHAYAPDARPVPSLRARLAVAEIDKTITVHGDRAFTLDDQLTEPARFTRADLRWERAAGGPGTSNPVGMRLDAPPDARGAVAVPNLAPPDIHVARRGDAIPPVGFGPIAPSWPGRRNKLHHRAATWDHRRWNEAPLPDDIDTGYFNVAPDDQQVAELHPDERIVLENLHPSHPQLATRLEPLAPRALADTGAGPAQEVRLRCDTLLIDTDRRVATLTWRGNLPLHHPTQPGRVVVTLEQRAPPAAHPKVITAPMKVVSTGDLDPAMIRAAGLPFSRNPAPGPAASAPPSPPAPPASHAPPPPGPRVVPPPPELGGTARLDPAMIRAAGAVLPFGEGAGRTGAPVASQLPVSTPPQPPVSAAPPMPAQPPVFAAPPAPAQPPVFAAPPMPAQPPVFAAPPAPAQPPAAAPVPAPVPAQGPLPVSAPAPVPALVPATAPVAAPPQVLAQPPAPVPGQVHTPVLGQAPMLGQPPTPVLGQPPTPMPGQAHTPVLGQAPMLGQPPTPMLGQPPTPVLGQPPTPVLGQPPTPMLGQPPTPVLGQPPVLGQAPAPVPAPALVPAPVAAAPPVHAPSYMHAPAPLYTPVYAPSYMHAPGRAPELLHPPVPAPIAPPPGAALDSVPAPPPAAGPAPASDSAPAPSPARESAPAPAPAPAPAHAAAPAPASAQAHASSPAPAPASPAPAPDSAPAPAPAEPELPLGEYPVERCAAITASIARRKAEQEAILEQNGLAPALWDALSRHWTEAVQRDMERGKTGLLAAYDDAYVGQLEAERGPIEVEEYARLSVAAERGMEKETLAELDLPRAAMLRIRRVWLRKTSKDTALARRLRKAIDDAE